MYAVWKEPFEAEADETFSVESADIQDEINSSFIKFTPAESGNYTFDCVSYLTDKAGAEPGDFKPLTPVRSTVVRETADGDIYYLTAGESYCFWLYADSVTISKTDYGTGNQTLLSRFINFIESLFLKFFQWLKYLPWTDPFFRFSH